MAPRRHLAVVHSEGGAKVEVKEIDVPRVGPNEVLVKVIAAAQNPVDWKMVLVRPTPGAVAGNDFAGIVEELGPGAETYRKIGERVGSFVLGGAYPRRDFVNNGAYAQYVVARADFCFTLPDSWSFEDAAALPIGAVTACQAFHQGLNINVEPGNPHAVGHPILVYGASSAVGMLVIQIAHLIGFTVYATSSPRHFETLRRLGASELFDYKEPHVGEKIRKASGGAIKQAIDCICEDGSEIIVSNAMSEEGGRVVNLLPKPSPRAGIDAYFVFAYDFLVESNTYEFYINRDNEPSRLTDAPLYAKLLTELLAKGYLKPEPIRLVQGGLDGVNEGYRIAREEKVSGEKIVYRISAALS